MTLVATKRPWVWKIGRAWISTSSAVYAPGLAQRLGVRNEIAVGQHRALRAPGGAGGVEQGGEIVGVARDGLEGVGLAARRLGQASPAIGVEREHACPGRGRDRLEALVARRVADEDGGLGVAEEVLDLGRRVAGVERQEDPARPHRGEVEHDRLDRLLDLGRDPVAGPQPQDREGVRHPPGPGDEVGIADPLARSRLDRDLVGVGDTAGEDVEEIGVHLAFPWICLVEVRTARHAAVGPLGGLPRRAWRTAPDAAIRPFSASASWFFSMSSSA